MFLNIYVYIFMKHMDQTHWKLITICSHPTSKKITIVKNAYMQQGIYIN